MNDEKTIRAIRDGDEAAIGQVIEKYSKLMWSIVSGVLRGVACEQDVEECVADVFIYLWKNPEKYDPGRGKMKAWLSIVARSRAIDRYRTLTRRGEVSLEEVQASDVLHAQDELGARQTRRDVEQALENLEEPDREILTRRYFQGQKPREIAQAMDLPVKGVENRLYRAKQKIRKAISD